MLARNNNPKGIGGVKKGDPSRNPSGKAKGYREFSELCRVYGSPLAFSRLMEAVEQADYQNAIAAARIVLAYAWGNPTHAIDITTTTVVTIEDARRALAERITRTPEPSGEVKGDIEPH